MRRLAARQTRDGQLGFTLIELLIATGILLTVSAVVLSLMFQMSMTQASVNNRTQMHSSVRSVTEVMQQEISQAGRITLPGATGSTTLNGAVAALATSAVVTSSSGMFVGEFLRVEDNISYNGENSEKVNVTAISGNTITATFALAHSSGAVVRPVGSFYAGIIPTAAAPASFTNGSSGTVLKIFGDINDDGNMLYEEYTCSPNAGGTGTLTRSVSNWNAVSKAAAVTLLNNLKTNPVDAGTGLAVPCFTFQQQFVTIGATTYWFVINVAITLTAQTPFKDAQTGVYQSETKALLNISPRNIYEDWRMASFAGSVPNPNVQIVPPSVTLLLP